MFPKAAKSYFLRQDDVHGVLRLFLSCAARLSQQVLPLLSNELAVLGVSQPRLAAAKKHNAGRSQDDQAGQQGQHSEADELTVCDQDAGGMDCLLQRDLQQVSFRWSEELVEGVSGDGVVLRGQREHSALCDPVADHLALGLQSVLQGTRGACERLLANTPEGSIRLTDARTPVAAGKVRARREASGDVTC